MSKYDSEVVTWFCFEQIKDQPGYGNSRIIGLTRRQADVFCNEPGVLRALIPWDDLMRVVEEGKKVVAQIRSVH